MQTRTALFLAAVFGLLAVLAGTFGAHGLKGRIEDDLLAAYEVGVRYQMYHALALLAIAGLLPRLGKSGSVAAVCWVFGMIVFAGSLYLLAVTGLRWLGMITPIGGVGLIVGWVLLAVAAWRVR